MQQVPGALRNTVRQRIEGERAALPGPALTPYLVGLLVMLGMLGTFLGMVVTFKGAVFALEGSTDLQAIRAALAAPGALTVRLLPVQEVTLTGCAARLIGAFMMTGAMKLVGLV